MASDVFRYVDGEMYCEQMSLRGVLKQSEEQCQGHLTPLFVYSKKQLHHNVQAYTNALKVFGCDFQLNFAIKANQNLSLLREMCSLGVSATLVSGNELKLALEAGFDPKTIMFNGGGKYYWETQLAVEHDVLLNVDSEWDLRQTIDICKHGFVEPKRARILLRLNLNIDPQVHKFINTGLIDCKFGLSEEGMENCLDMLEEPGSPANLVGLHCHLGSTIYQTDVFKTSVERLLAIRDQLIHRGFSSIHILNVGGGLGIDYVDREMESRPWRGDTDNNQNDLLSLRQFLKMKAKEPAEDPEELLPYDPTEFRVDNTMDVQKVRAALNQMADSISLYRDERISFGDVRDALKDLLTCCPRLKSYVDRTCPGLTCMRAAHASAQDLIQSVSGLLQDKGVTLMLEPGRSLVANTCVLLSRVLGEKQTLNKRYAVLDASMTEVIRPSLYGSYHHVSVVMPPPQAKSKLDQQLKRLYDVVGPVCECTDFIAKDRLLPDLSHGLLVIHDVGAYCHSMSSNYNVRMKAAEVLVDGDSCKLIRRQDTFEDFMAPYRNLP